MNLESLSQNEMILLAVAGLIGVFIIMKIAKSLIKFALFAGIAAFLFYLVTGSDMGGLFEPGLETMFKNTTIRDLQAKHCATGKEDNLKCKCLVSPIYADMEDRLGAQGISRMEKDKQRMVDEMMSSFKARRGEIQECLGGKGEEGKAFLKKAKELIEVLSNKN